MIFHIIVLPWLIEHGAIPSSMVDMRRAYRDDLARRRGGGPAASGLSEARAENRSTFERNERPRWAGIAGHVQAESAVRLLRKAVMELLLSSNRLMSQPDLGTLVPCRNGKSLTFVRHSRRRMQSRRVSTMTLDQDIEGRLRGCIRRARPNYFSYFVALHVNLDKTAAPVGRPPLLRLPG